MKSGKVEHQILKWTSNHLQFSHTASSSSSSSSSILHHGRRLKRHSDFHKTLAIHIYINIAVSLSSRASMMTVIYDE